MQRCWRIYRVANAIFSSVKNNLAFVAPNPSLQMICPTTTEQQSILLAGINLPTLDMTNHILPMPIHISISEYDVLTEFFFNQSVMPVGWYSFLPKLHLQTPPDGCLRAALFATSCFLAANQFQDAEMMQKAQRRYGIALRAVNAAIADPICSLQDETLVSILLLNILDDITGQNSFGSYCHLEGCAQLIKRRQENDFQTENSHDLAHSIVMQIQPAILEGHRQHTGTLNKDLIGRWLCHQSIPSPAVEILSFCLQINRLGKKILEAFTQNTATGQDCTLLLIMLLEDGMNLERSMAKWCIFHDKRWERRCSATVIKNNVPLHYYSDIQVAKTWNHWRVARIVLHTLLLDLVSRLQVSVREFQGNFDILHVNSSTIIKRMLSEISASIPYHLQQIDNKGRITTQTSQRALGGRALIWPLKMVMRCKWTINLYKQEASETLRFIGEVIGFKQAIAFLEETAQS